MRTDEYIKVIEKSPEVLLAEKQLKKLKEECEKWKHYDSVVDPEKVDVAKRCRV